MSLQSEIEAAFEPGGVLSRATDHFIVRPGQTEMALAVAIAIQNAEALVVEASTGVGKTFSYLVPALLCGERVLISTATKALQDQLFSRDLPSLLRALGVHVSTALLKGRASYVCLHRVSVARQDANITDATLLRSLAKIEQWSQTTRAGDLAELPGLDERSPLIPLVTSTRENCLGSQCPQFRACHVSLARREAMAADVVVINHHLFFADQAVRESGMAELLPSVRVAIFDEAHQLNEIGIQFLGKNLTTGQLLDFCRDMHASGLQLARGLADWQKVAGFCELAARDLKLSSGKNHPGTKLRWTEQTPEQLAPQAWRSALKAVVSSLIEASSALSTVSEIAPEFVRLQERALALTERAESFLNVCSPDAVRWLEVGPQLRLVESPLSIADTMKNKLLATSGESAKTWIFTSATLGDDKNLSWFTVPCGLTQARVMRVGSPFNYARQAALYVPLELPKSLDPAHASQVALLVATWARQLGGRTMVLTTTLKALRTIGAALESAFQHSPDLQVLVQGTMPKSMLIERFRQGGSFSGSGYVLVGSASFWEGIDVPGNALQLVVIDKLPFPPPNDPMVEARCKALQAAGQNPFNDYFLPEAAVALKQGAGRLIRRETDSGVLVVCDTRLVSMGYGKRLLKALPAMKNLTSAADMTSQLTKLGTTDDLLP